MPIVLYFDKFGTGLCKIIIVIFFYRFLFNHIIVFIFKRRTNLNNTLTPLFHYHGLTHIIHTCIFIYHLFLTAGM